MESFVCLFLFSSLFCHIKFLMHIKSGLSCKHLEYTSLEFQEGIRAGCLGVTGTYRQFSQPQDPVYS